MKSVVVTGLGAVTPLGDDLGSTWQALLAGTSGVVALTDDWAADMPARIAAPAKVDVSTKLERVEARKLDRVSQLAMIAAREAWADAALEGVELDPTRLAVSVGTGIGGLHTLLANWDALQEKGPRRVSPLTIPMLMANAPAANVGLMIGARAGVHCPVSACASSNEAVAQGVDLIRLGRADLVVVGGSEAVINPLPMAGFANMQALSRRNDEPQRASRPWDVERDGFVLGEGSAMIILESAEHAKARGAKVYATIAGAGISADSHDIVQPEPSGAGQALAVANALRESGLQASDIKHVNAHATSTPQGDVTEAGSIRKALNGAEGVVVTGTKSMTGHLLGGAGALETIFTIKAVQERVAPPTINLENPEPGLGIDIATEPRDLGQGDLAAINNSFGFGGANVAIAVTNADTNR